MALCEERRRGAALRIEDLDPDRCRPEYAELLREDLLFLGLDWDREGTPQSRRRAAYDEAFAALSSQGLIYPCYCSRAALHAASAPHASDGAPVYPGTCRDMTETERARQNRPPRLPCPRSRPNSGFSGRASRAL